MATYIKQGDIFGRIGSGIGQGIAQQLPEEITRGRLSAGLQNLESQQGLTPFQQFSRLAAVPGVTPQMLQSGSEVLRQQQYLNALRNQYGQGQEGQNVPPSNRPLPTREQLGITPQSTLATPETTQQSYKTYIPPTVQQERDIAYDRFEKNPARYNYNFDNALADVQSETGRHQEIQQAQQKEEAIAVGKEEQVKKALADEAGRLGLTAVPPKVMQDFEKKILSAILPKNEGGEGLTQEQAVKKYSEQAREANRNYLDLGAMDTWKPWDFNRITNSLQKDFAKRGEQQLMMDQMVADYGISPTYAAHRAYPTNENEQKILSSIPGGLKQRPLNVVDYEKLKKSMGKTGSPLSIAYELERKEIDPSGWFDYLNNNRDDLEVWQSDQLSKNRNIVNLVDVWLRAWE